MKSKRVSFENPCVDKELLNLFNSNTCDDHRHKIAIRALKEIVKEELSERQKEFIVLYYYEQKTMVQIAEICQVNVSTVSRTLRRARKNITDRIKYYYIT